jgi:hypothetical protein
VFAGCMALGTYPLSPHGSGSNPKSNARFNSLNGIPMSNPVRAAASRSRLAAANSG